MPFHTLDQVDVAGKRVLLRADLNVPVRDGKITDLTRIERLSPTIRELADKGARVIVCSHFDRPKGKRVRSMSLAPMAAALGEVLGRHVRFVEDCTGVAAEQAVGLLSSGGVVVLENTRFHAGEEKNDPAFAAALAKLAEIFVNDAFSAAHRAHASTEGVAHILPAYAGRLMQAELEALEAALGSPVRPVAAIVGGAKVSTKLELLGNLVGKVDVLVIGGAMANTFLSAQGKAIGKSLEEADMHDTARQILDQASKAGCRVVLPTDVVVAPELKPGQSTRTVSVDAVPGDMMILDVGPASVARSDRLATIAEDSGLERTAGCVRNAPIRRRDVHAGACRCGGDANRWIAQRLRRRRHGFRAAPRRRYRSNELRLRRGRRVPGVARRKNLAGRSRYSSGENWSDRSMPVSTGTIRPKGPVLHADGGVGRIPINDRSGRDRCSLAIVARHTLPRPDQFAVALLLQSVGDPPSRPSDSKDRQRGPMRKAADPSKPWPRQTGLATNYQAPLPPAKRWHEDR